MWVCVVSMHGEGKRERKEGMSRCGGSMGMGTGKEKRWDESAAPCSLGRQAKKQRSAHVTRGGG